MKLFLLDDFDDASEKVIESYLIAENVTFEKLDNFDNFDDFEKFDSVCVVASVEYNFVSKDMFKFVKHLIKKQIKANLQVMFIESFNQNAKIAIDWLFSLKDNYLFDVDVLGEFSRENLSEDLKLFLGSKQTKLDVTQKNNDNNVVIYTDGACSGNPGAGGWGAILMHGNHKKEISGFEPETTNNRMELTAVIVALSSLKAPCCVELYSDSAYVVNAIKQGWLENWKKNGWIGSDKKQVKNIELWKALDELMQKHTVNFNKVKGHADNPFNNRCDELATGEIAKNANNA